MNSIPAARTRLQQQPSRMMDRQQQQSSGSGEFQPRQQGGGVRTNHAGEAFAERSSDRERWQQRGIEQ